MCHVSRMTCHVSPVTCHVSPVTCHLSRCYTGAGLHVCHECSFKSNDKNHIRIQLQRTRNKGTVRKYICHEYRLKFQSEHKKINQMETYGICEAKCTQADQGGALFLCPICGNNALSNKEAFIFQIGLPAKASL